MSTTLTVDPGPLEAVRAALVHLAAGRDVDIDAALADPDAVRETLRLLARHAPLRAAVHPTHPDAVTDPDPVVAGAAVDQVIAQMKARADQARKQEKAAKRGTAEQRRLARLEADLTRVRNERAAATQRAADATAVAADLRAALADLTAAIREESARADAADAVARATRDSLTEPRTLARHLLQALDTEPQVLQASLVVAPDAQRATIAGWVRQVLSEIATPVLGRARARAQALSVTMLGGGVEVGGSCALVTASGTRVLVDAGVRPGATTVAQMPPPGLAAALEAGPVDAVILTHAHADHCGWVPAVLATCPGVPVYATAATADLLAPMWSDTVRIFDRGDGPGPYAAGEVTAALAAVHPVPFSRPVQVGALTFELFPAGHILGAAGVHLSDGTHRVVISGDVSPAGQSTVGGWQLPEAARRPDLLVLESTYGASPAHRGRGAALEELVRDVELTVNAGGRVLVPAFALGRAQEVALALSEALPTVPVFLDGLARDITDVFEQHTGPDGRPIRVWSDTVQAVPRGQTAQWARRTNRCVIVTTSGMLTAGPVVTWAAQILPDPRSLLAIVGYQDPGSPGGQLLRVVERGERVDLPGPDGAPWPVEVNAPVRRYGLGAHASADDLVAIATHAHAGATMLVHGDPAARDALTDRLVRRHLPVTDPDTAWVGGH